MSRTIDERVVEMKFDNSQFENNVKTSMNTLDKLKSSLKLDGISKGLDDVDKSVKKLDMSPLSKGLETVQTHFSAMQVVAITALANITNSAIEAGKNLVNAFAVQPIKDGFAEYELLMDSVKTIKASTGETVQTINGYLDELNAYADQTIYTFSDMTQNIGKFTNSGVQLDSAVKAIKGISNEAAVSGANANEASRAMYNFAQALSAGYVKLIDWKSIENANMATVEFKQSLLDTALAMGTVVKEGDDYITTTTNAQGKISGAFNATKGFNDALQHQWMTSDVLIQTLEQYSTDVTKMSAEEKKAYEEKLRSIGYTEDQISSIEALGTKAAAAATEVTKFSQLIDVTKEAVGSGWAQTFRLIFGDFDESKKLWTEVGNAVTGYVDKISDARNETVKIWKILGGRESAIQIGRNIFEALSSVLKPIGDAFNDIFPPVAPRNIVAMTKAIEELTSHLKISDSTAENIKKTFSGVFSVFHMFGSAISAVVKTIFPMSSVLRSMGSTILEFTGGIGEWLTTLDKALTENNYFENSIKGLVQIINDGITSVKNFANSVIQNFTKFNSINELLDAVKNKIKSFSDSLKNAFSFNINAPDMSPFVLLSDKLKDRFQPLSAIGQLMGKIFSAIGKTVSIFFPVITKAFDGMINAVANLSEALLKALDNGGFRAFFDVLNAGLLAGIGIGISKFVKNLTGLGDSIGESIEGFTGIGSSIKGTFDQLTGSLKAMEGSIKADILQKIAVSVAILTGSLVALSLIDSDKLVAPLAALSTLLFELVGAMKAMTTLLTSEKGGIFGGIENALNSFALSNMGSSLIKIAGAMFILAGAMKMLSSLNPSQLVTSLIAIGASLTMFVITLRAMPDNKKIGLAATSILILSSSMVVLGGALKIMGSLNVEQLVVALTALGGSLAIMITELRNMPDKGAISSAGSILILSNAMIILGGALKIMGSLNVEQLVIALTALGGSLAIMVTALRNMPEQGVLKSVAALFTMSTAMTILGGAIKIMGSLNVEQLVIALTALGGSLAIMITALRNMPEQGVLKSSAALFIMSTSLIAIGGALKIMGSLNVEQLAVSLIALGGSLAIMVIALRAVSEAGLGGLVGAASITVMTTALIGLGMALKIFGSMNLSEIGIGLLGMAGALTVLLIAGAAAETVALGLIVLAGTLAAIGVAALACGAGIMMLSAGLAALAVSGLAGATALVGIIEVLVIGLLNAIADSAVALKEAVVAVILSCLEAFVETKEAFVESMLELIETVLTSLVEHGPSIIDKLLEFVIILINGIAARIPDIGGAIGNLIKAIVNAIIDGANSLSGGDVESLIKNITMLTVFFGICAGLSMMFVPAMAGVSAFGVLVTELALVLALVGGLNKIPGLKDFVDSGGELLESVGIAIGRFVGGFIGGALDTIIGQLPDVGLKLSQFMMNAMPFIAGARLIKPEMLDGVKALAETVVVLTGASIIDGIASFFSGGGSNLVEFGKTINEFAPYIASFGETIKNVDATSIEAAANAGKTLSEMAKNLPRNGGVFDGILGQRSSMQDFGNQLDWFGYYIVKFSERVAGKIDQAAVEAATNAGKTMVELANALPRTNGFIQQFAGQKNLQDFGNQLDWFGYYIVKFSNRVTGKINEDAVSASKNAGMMMVELANTLPTTGGFIQALAGEKNMESFGRQLDWFGYYLVSYSTRMASITIESLSASTEEIKKIIALARDLSGVDTTVFGNFSTNLTLMAQNGIDGFVSAFQNSSVKANNAVSGLFNNVSNAVSSYTPVLLTVGTEAGETIAQALIDGLNNKRVALTTTANSVCSEFISMFKTKIIRQTWYDLGFYNVMGALIDSITYRKKSLITLCTGLCTELVGIFRKILLVSIFTAFGRDNIMKSLIDGISSKSKDLFTLVREICSEVVKLFTDGLSKDKFKKIGEDAINALIDSFKSDKAKGSLKAAVKELTTLIIEELEKVSKSKEIEKVGVNITLGLAEGIKNADAKKQVNKAITDVIKEAVAASKKESQEKSPSKVFAEIGKFFDLGLAQGIDKYAGEVSASTKKLSRTAIDTMRAAISGISDLSSEELDIRPTITPVVDLSNIQNGSKKLRGLLTKGLDTSVAYNNALRTSISSNGDYAIPNTESGASISNNYNFTQNNYSPKALSRKEIYRQTRNQFSALKGAVSGT